jgi:type I restriction enzyme R subunit
VLLAIATGAGKTRIAAVALRQLFDAGWLGRALFVCDRTELRDNGLGDFQALFGNDAAEVDTKHPQKNARVLVATYQTLDKSQEGEDASFFLKLYPPDYFDIIVIDECSISIFDALEVIVFVNRLTKVVVVVGETAFFFDDLARFEIFHLGQCDLFHDFQLQPERVRGVLKADAQDKTLTDELTGQPLTPDALKQRYEGASLERQLIMPLPTDAPTCGFVLCVRCS